MAAVTQELQAPLQELAQRADALLAAAPGLEQEVRILTFVPPLLPLFMSFSAVGDFLGCALDRVTIRVSAQSQPRYFCTYGRSGSRCEGSRAGLRSSSTE